MPSKKRNGGKKASGHEEFRSRICCCCGSKKNTSPIGDAGVNLVKTFVFSGYSTEVLSYPTGLCGTCQRQLYKAKKGEPVSDEMKRRWESVNLEELSVKVCRGGESCDCNICKVGRHNVKTMVKGEEPSLRGPQRVEVKAEPIVKHCPHCWQETGRGIPHNCKASSSVLAENFSQILFKEDPKTREQVFAKFVYKLYKKIFSFGNFSYEF